MIDELKPYPEYKDSGLPWVAALPNHWKVERAKGRFQKLNRPIRPEDETVTCFRDGTVTLRKNRRLRGFTEAIYELGYQGIRKGDLVIHAMDAFAGAVGVSDSDGKGSPIYGVCRPKFDDSPHYFAHVVREMSRTQWILALSRGIRERSTDFRFESFARQFVPLPPPDEQAAIDKFLDYANGKIERAIRAKRKLIGLLNEQKQAIIHRAVTRGLDPNVKLKPSGIPWLGDIPEHWEVWRISRFACVGNGSTPSRAKPTFWNGGRYPWLNSSQVNRGYIDNADQFVTRRALRECHLPIVPTGSVLIAITGQGKTRGTAAVLGIDATINQHVAYITIQIPVVGSEYLHLALSAAYQTLRDLSEDSGSTKGALTCADLKRFKVALPPMQEQACLVRFVRNETLTLEAIQARTEREIAFLREYRTTLTAEVVTGKLDVREAAKRLPDQTNESLPADESLDDLVDDEIT